MGPIPALILTVGVSLIAAFLILRGVGLLERRALRRFQAVIEVNETGVSRTTKSLRESITWAALTRVSIVTNDEGPFAEDVWWVLEDAAGGVAVPGSAPEVKAIMARLERLPGYNPEAVVRAMGSTENARFTVWERAN